MCAIRSAAEGYGREVPEDHYGTIVPFHFGDGDISAEIQTLMRRIDPNTPFESYAAWREPDAILRRIDEYVKMGVSKFVLRPMVSGASVLRSVGSFGQARRAPVSHRLKILPF